jgi:hypothetical protein
MTEHKSDSEKIDMLVKDMALLTQVVVGDEKNCIPGVCGRLKKLEDVQFFMMSCVAIAGVFFGSLWEHIKGGMKL